MGADQLAVVAGEAMAAGGADLAVVIDGPNVRQSGSSAPLCEISAAESARKSEFEGARPLRQHAGQISMEESGRLLCEISGRRPTASTARRRTRFPEVRRPGNPTNNHRILESPKEGLWQARQVRFGQVH